VERFRRTRRTVSVAAVAAALSVAAGCSSGFDATSTQPYAPSDGILADSGDLRVLNALVVSDDAGRAGVVSMTVVNRGERDDRLLRVTSPDASVSLDGPVELPAGQAVLFDGSGEATALVSGMTSLPGSTIELRLEFARTEPVTLRTVVVEATGDYADFTPPPLAPATL